PQTLARHGPGGGLRLCAGDRARPRARRAACARDLGVRRPHPARKSEVLGDARRAPARPGRAPRRPRGRRPRPRRRRARADLLARHEAPARARARRPRRPARPAALRAPHLDRAVEGSPQRATLQGDAERALLLRPAAPLPVPVRARRRPRAPHGGPAGSPLARVHPERARRARPGVPGRARERLLGGPAARPRRQVGDLPRQGRRKFDSDAARRADPADRRHRVGHPRLRRRRHALRRDDGARPGSRGALPRPPAAGAGAGAPGRGEGDRGGAAGRAARRRRPLARTPRRRRHDLSHRRRPHLRRHPGSMTSRERALGWLAGLGLTAGLVMAFGVAPREATQGNVQRIMYLHVPAILVAYLAFGVVLVASVIYLWGRAAGADRLAHASAEVGVVFTGINIATGAIWGKPTWGTWWTWDARLTSVSIMFVIYLGYLLLRAMIEDRERAARFAAVLG